MTDIIIRRVKQRATHTDGYRCKRETRLQSRIIFQTVDTDVSEKKLQRRRDRPPVEIETADDSITAPRIIA